MTKTTEQHRKYAKLPKALSMKSSIRANKLFENWVNPLANPRVALTVTLKQ